AVGGSAVLSGSGGSGGSSGLSGSVGPERHSDGFAGAGDGGRRDIPDAPVPPGSGAVATSAPPRQRRLEQRSIPEDDVDLGSSNLVTGLTVLLLLLIAGFGAWWWLDRQESESATSAELAETDSTQTEDTEADSEAAAGDTEETATTDDEAGTDEDAAAVEDGAEDTEAEQAAPLPSLIGADGMATIDLTLIDPVGRSDATGTTGLTFDMNTEQVCYRIGLNGVGQPADGHIHLGPAGVKGGIIVDFGPMSDGLTGCEPVAAAEMQAILSDIDGHYVELHDPVEDFTVRAQLSEGLGADGQPIEVAEVAGTDSSMAEELQFDPDGNGAVALIEPGRIIVYGLVSDREVAETVLVDFAGLSDVVVVDELIVNESAPLPSGRIIIDNPEGSLFATGSDVLDPEFDPLVDQLVGLLEARPNWVVTVVGHTDSTGDDVINLELSLARAEAVRAAMVEGGIEPDRVRVRGAGSTDPLASNDLPNGRDQNRRIEFEVQR
ncbi:MAG: OmpA family protein, partial [Actinomycetota bacterium]